MTASDVSKNLRGVFHAPASWVLVAVLIVIQLLVELGGGTTGSVWWFEQFGLSREGFLTGKIWQPVSYGWLHGGWWHAVLNALFLLCIGSRIEHVAGSAALCKCLGYGVLSGGICHILLGAGLLVGLSGGCFALLLLLTTLSPQSRMFPIPLSGRSLGGGMVLSALVLALINPEAGLPGLAMVGRKMAEHGLGSWFQIGHACHFGGGFAGWLYGRWMLRPRVTLARLRRERAARDSR